MFLGGSTFIKGLLRILYNAHDFIWGRNGPHIFRWRWGCCRGGQGCGFNLSHGLSHLSEGSRCVVPVNLGIVRFVQRFFRMFEVCC